MQLIQFEDKMVTYDSFVNDLTSRIVKTMKSQHNDPEHLSQRMAYSIFGRGNVDRWRKQGKLTVRKRPGKVEYCTVELRFLQQIEQDYF